MKIKFIGVLTLLYFGILANANIFAQEGEVFTYYSDGNGKSREYYAHGVREGKSYWYYSNGKLKAEKNYTDGKLDGWLRYYFESGIIKEEHHITAGILDGISNYYYKNGGLHESRNYRKGILISRDTVAYDSTFITTLSSQSVVKRKSGNIHNDDYLCDADICPEPIGGLRAIQEKLVYPVHAKLYGLEGDVLIAATIDSHGNVLKVKVAKGIGLGCDEAAIEAVRSTRFIPGQVNGKTVKSNVSFKVKFRLKNKPLIASELSPVRQREQVFLKNTQPVSSGSANAKVIIGPNGSAKKSVKDTANQSFINCKMSKCPQPKGGLSTILENLNYPVTAQRIGIQGEVIVKAVVDEYGFVLDTKVIKGLGYGCDEAAEMAVLRTGFIPAEENNKPVKASVNIKIPFKLKNIIPRSDEK